MKKKQLRESIHKKIIALCGGKPTEYNPKEECREMVREVIGRLAPYIIEASYAESRYETSSSIKNGSYMEEKREEANEAHRNARLYLNYRYNIQFKECVSVAEIEGYVYDAIREFGLSTYEVYDLMTVGEADQ